MLFYQTILVYTLLSLGMFMGVIRSVQKTRFPKLWAWLPIILFTVVFGLRYGVGIDYFNYEYLYDYMDSYSSFKEALEDSRLEGGFLLIMYICNNVLHWPTYSMFAVMAFLQIFLLYKTFNKEGQVLAYIYLALVLTSACVGGFMNIIRQGVAICLFWYAVKFIIDRKPLQYWAVCLIAYFFHHSALILFPLYFVWIRRKSLLNFPKVELPILILTFFSSFVTQWQNFLGLFDKAIIFLGYEGYIERADTMFSGGSIGIFSVLTLLVNGLIVINSKQIKEHLKSNLFNILYDIYFVGTCLSYLFMGSMMLNRMIAYFSNTTFIVLGYALCYFHQVRKESVSLMMKYAFVALYILMSFGILIRDCKINTAAYVSVFQTDMHIEKENLYEDMIQKRE